MVARVLALPFYLHMLLGLNSLMESVRITAARMIRPVNSSTISTLIVLHHIVPVAEHQVVGPQSQNDVVLDSIFSGSDRFSI